MDKISKMSEYFTEVETTEEHNGYNFSVGEALIVVILGSICGLRNICQIHQWAVNPRVSEFLLKELGIEKLPCYYWLTCLLKIIKPESLNQCFASWAQSLLPDNAKCGTISFDGKTIRSTCKMDKYAKPLHIVSAHLAELGITLASRRVDEKENEIPAVRDLLQLMNVEGCMIVADTLHCQKETAALVIEKKADYLLNVKGNQETLMEDIELYVQDDDLRESMDTATTVEKNGGRIEQRRAFVCCDIDWLHSKGDWKGLACIAAINTKFTYKGKTSDEWHYYISSRKLTSDELVKHARLEWSVESMHWLLDVHFGEDFCRVEDENTQHVLNVARKIALNSVKTYKRLSASKLPLSKIMFDCLLDCNKLASVLLVAEN